MSDARPELAQELFDYVGFGDEDARVLGELGPALAPYHARIVERFYAVIRRHPAASFVFADEAQIERQKRALQAWLVTAFSGDYGDEWFTQRLRIGEVHARYGSNREQGGACFRVVIPGVHVP